MLTDWFLITEWECVYCAVGTESLNIIQANFSLERVGLTESWSVLIGTLLL